MPDFYRSKKITRRRPPQFDLIAGVACLDFINTLDDRFNKEPKELLKTYLDLARFGEDTGILNTYEVDQLSARSEMYPAPAQRVLESAKAMREAMSTVFEAIRLKKPMPPAAMTNLNQFVQAAGEHSRLVPVNGRCEWRFDALPLDFDRPLWPIARSAADLLASDQLALVRTCASDTCQWYFLDTSRNHRRRWCDMTKCGNRAKFRRFYSRKRKLTT